MPSFCAVSAFVRPILMIRSSARNTVCAAGDTRAEEGTTWLASKRSTVELKCMREGSPGTKNTNARGSDPCPPTVRHREQGKLKENCETVRLVSCFGFKCSTDKCV